MRLAAAFFLIGALMWGAEFKDSELAVKKIALFSSGVGFYELGGELNGASKIALSFDRSQMDDVLKSLAIYDSSSVSPFISYAGEETIERALQSLRIDLKGKPTIENILLSLKGESVEIAAPNKVIGKIVGVQTRQSAKDGASFEESVLTLFSDGKLTQTTIKEIESYRFTDPKINETLEKALLFLASANNGDRRVLNLYLDGKKKREVTTSFVIEAPVWKANYRLDLSPQKPFLQGWAIIDNASDSDWNNVELSLVVGRPVSFRQPYYAPFYTKRPELPLMIEGFAQATTYESGYAQAATADTAFNANKSFSRSKAVESEAYFEAAYGADAQPAPFAQNYETALAKAAGEQFVYTLKNKITLARRQSAMAPLTQGAIDARKVVIFSEKRGQNPTLGVELKNSLDIKLPAGAISVYDGGVYAGDALLEFLPQNEKRLIGYGDDLSVRGIVNQRVNSSIDSVKIAKGVMTIASKSVYYKEYAFKNNSNSAKTLILEHPIAYNSKLIEPSKPLEKTESLYRFEVALNANKETKFSVAEESRTKNQITILDVPYNTLLVYIDNVSYPKEVREALEKAAPYALELDSAKIALAAAQKNLERKSKDQDRIRQNLVAVGADSAQGKNYAGELVALDKEIAALNKSIDDAIKAQNRAQKAYDDYIAKLKI
ncbi:MAG: DUF4139 domain-containing protein [Helicobacteraceae bacterium]|jgi:hypothetical protein|nr:DUF4139 domain-containing protein [Helicobacteraceae bacterium]